MHVHGTLETNLKRLRMPAMLENLNIRLKEAEETNLGFLELLALLVQDEIDSRESNNLNKRLKLGGFSPRMTFETYDFRFNAAAISPATVRDLATCKFIRDGRSLVLCGPPGIGKTHISQALGHEVCRRGGDALFIKTQRLLEDLSNTLYPRRSARLWKQLGRVELLILDDFGFRRYEQQEAEILYSLADVRMNSASTIITSNRPPQDWYGVFPDPVIGGAILDRMVSPAIKIIVEKAESYRKLSSYEFPTEP